jgi:hypothetical protein
MKTPAEPGRGAMLERPKEGLGLMSAEINWTNDWNGALAAARGQRKVILIDVMKDP